MNNFKVNKIDFDNPGHIKLCLLSEGITIKDKSIFFAQKFAENQFPYGYSSKLIRLFDKIPSELILPNEVIVGLHLIDRSPWSLVYINKTKNYFLTHKGKKITKIFFNPKPIYYGKKLSSGLLSEKLAVMYGLYTLSFFTRGWCYYFTKNVQCKFCSLEPTRKTLGRENVNSITPKIVAEAAKLALQLDGKRIFYFNYCSGSHKDNNVGVELQTKVLKALKKFTPNRIKHHMLTMPPDDFSLLKILKKKGMGTLNFAIEVFNPDSFKEICSGKEQYYGYDRYLQAYGKAVKIFGRGKVYANFVAGLEHLDSMVKGFEYFAKRGVAPSVNVFHPDPESELSHKLRPSIEYLFEMVKMQTDIYKKNKFLPIFPKGGSRNSLDTEVYKGYF